MINFGTGKLIAVPQYLADGSAIANPTPVVLADLQEISIDASIETKMLYGSKRYPIAAGQGKGKIELKAKNAMVSGAVLGSLYLGKSSSAGIKAAKLDFAATVPGTPFQLTVTPPSSGTFVADLGVFNASTGAQLKRVASSPATGEYSVSAGGQYTFATADEDDNILLSYEYSASAGGEIWTITNDLMGYMPSFSALLQSPYDGKNLVVKLNRATSSKFSLPLKSDDYTIPDFDAEAFADAAGNLGYICLF